MWVCSFQKQHHHQAVSDTAAHVYLFHAKPGRTQDFKHGLSLSINWKTQVTSIHNDACVPSSTLLDNFLGPVHIKATVDPGYSLSVKKVLHSTEWRWTTIQDAARGQEWCGFLF